MEPLSLNSLPVTAAHVGEAELKEKINNEQINNESTQLPDDESDYSRLYFFAKLVQTIILCPITTSLTLAFRIVKLLTWCPAKAALYKIQGNDAGTYLESEYLNTVKAVRDLLFLPAVAKRAYDDMVADLLEYDDDIVQKTTKDYLKVEYTQTFEPYSSYLHGYETFNVIHPTGIVELPAVSDPSLRAVMASDFLQPNMMAINFGSPNVSTFITKQEENGSVQTVQVDAKSLKRAEMTYHVTNGKIQSGIFMVPTNLPPEALIRFNEAATKMQGRSDYTCVNTNCRVLKEAGFSIEGVEMEDVIFPTTLMEHLLYRNVVYTDLAGNTHKVHFDILNTTPHTLEEYAEVVDTAVVGTRLRHHRRDNDTEEDKKARGAEGKELLAQQRERLANAPKQQVEDADLGQRTVTVSVPSLLGNLFAGIWGRHTIYEMDLSDKQEAIAAAFQKFVNESSGTEQLKLLPFPQENPNFITRLKRDYFFSAPMIRFLRNQMIGDADELVLNTQDLFAHLKSTKGAHLNYVLLDDKVVFAKVRANGDSDEGHKKAADWALSKHALLSNREEVYSSGELWYDDVEKCFMLNNDSGTYKPSLTRVALVAELVNIIFDTKRFGSEFRVAVPEEQNAKSEKAKLEEQIAKPEEQNS